MKLTWFGGTTIRIHIGGVILVLDPEGAPAGIDRTELTSGADVVISAFGAELPTVELATWRPRRAPRLLDEGEALPKAEVYAAGPGAVLVEAIGEAPLLLMWGEVPALGRWADGAVAVLFGDGAQLTTLGHALLDDVPPKLIALAADETAVDTAIAALRDKLDGTGLVSLEAGLALEV